MPVKYNTMNGKNVSNIYCGFSGNIVYYVCMGVAILVIIFGFGLHKKLSNVKVQLESCRSSMRSD